MKLADLVRRQHAGRIATMNARLLDVLHDPADDRAPAVSYAVNIDLDCVINIVNAIGKECVKQHGSRCILAKSLK